MDFKKLRKLTFLFFLTIFTIILIFLYDLCQEIIHTDQEFYQTDHEHILYQLQHEDNPLNKKIADFQKIYNSLKGTDLYTYYELYTQPLYFGEAKEVAEAVQISENVQNDFGLKVADGRLFVKEDFILNGDTIPVYLGADYINQYDLGDSFSAEYLFDQYHFLIVGFLEKNSKIKTSFREIPLDGCIVMPGFDISPNKEVMNGIKIHYANKTSGMIKTTFEQEEKTKKYFEKILESGNVGTYSWASNLLSVDIRNNFNISLTMLRTTICFAIIALLMTAVVFYGKNRKFFLEICRNSSTNFVKWIIFTIIVCLSCGIIIGVLQVKTGYRPSVIKYMVFAFVFDGAYYLTSNFYIHQLKNKCLK